MKPKPYSLINIAISSLTSRPRVCVSQGSATGKINLRTTCSVTNSKFKKAAVEGSLPSNILSLLMLNSEPRFQTKVLLWLLEGKDFRNRVNGLGLHERSKDREPRVEGN